MSQSDSAGSLVSDGDVELPVKTTIAADVSIVSLQSTACPGAILQLDRILDAEHVCPFSANVLMLIHGLGHCQHLVICSSLILCPFSGKNSKM